MPKNYEMLHDQLLRELAVDFRLNPNLVVYIRADENSRTKELAALISGW